MFDRDIVRTVALTKLGLTQNTKKTYKDELVFEDCPSCGRGEDRFNINCYKGQFWCRSCGYSGSIVTLLQERLEIDISEAFKMLGEDKGGGGCDVYIYTDEDEKPLFEHRTFIKDGSKRQYKTLPGSASKPKGHVFRSIPYDYMKVVRAQRVAIAEGEKDAETLKRLGYVGTTNPNGSGSFLSLEPETVERAFKGKDVLVFYDKDNPGYKWRNQVCDRLYDLAKSIKVIDLPNMEEKQDVSDFVQREGLNKAREIIQGLEEKAKNFVPKSAFRKFSNLIKEIDVDVPSVIGAGVLLKNENLLIGAEYGQMKSMLRLQLAVCLAGGIPFLHERFSPTMKGVKVGILQWENSDGLERKRFIRMCEGLGLDPSEVGQNIFINHRDERFDLTQIPGKRALIERVKSIDVDVVMLDNLSNMHTGNENDNIQMRQVCDSLSEMNAKLDVTTVLVHHLGKPSGDKTELRYRIRGASSIQDWASSILLIDPVGDDDPPQKQLTFPKIRDPQDNSPRGKGVFVKFDDWHFEEITEPTRKDSASVETVVQILRDRALSRKQLANLVSYNGKVSGAYAEKLIDVAQAMDRITEEGGVFTVLS